MGVLVNENQLSGENTCACVCVSMCVHVCARKRKWVWVVNFTNLKMYSIHTNNKYTILYCKLYTASWFSYNAFVDFYQTLLSIADLWLQLANKHRPNTHVEHPLSYMLSSKTKVKQWKCIDSIVNDVGDSFIKLNNSFLILKDYWLNSLYDSRSNSCYGLNACILPKFTWWNPNPQCAAAAGC